MTISPQQPNLPEMLGYALVAPRIRVLYVPTTKVACSTLKLLISQIEGTYNEEAKRIVITPNISQEQTIHNYLVHGLTRFFDLKPKRQWEILNSDQWLRVGTLRDPLSRAYSSWENRVLLRAPGTPKEIFDRCPDVLVDGRIDVTGSFKNFAKELHADLETFIQDDHFRPQFSSLYSDQVDYHHLVRVDVPGELQQLADILNERGGTNVPLARLNSGIGIKPPQVYDAETARLVTEVYERDFEWYGFSRKEFPEAIPAFVLDPLQQHLLDNLRETTERLSAISTSAFSRVGFRYGIGQMLKSVGFRLKFKGKDYDPKLLQW